MDTPEKWFIVLNGEKIEAPSGYYADPFLMDDWMFFEHYTEKGAISVMHIPTKKVTKVLELDHHLSFPNVFKHEGEYYMIPEEGAISQIRLFRAKKFPFEWEVVKVLKEGIHAGDTEVFHKDKWYLFTTNANDNKLWLEQADDLFGEWRFVMEKSIPNSRPAGKMFEKEGKIYRPVQKTVSTYGEGVIIKEIRFPYEEVSETEIENSYPNATGFHTYNFNDKYTVIDIRV